MPSIKKNALYNLLRTVVTFLFPIITYPYVLRVLLPDYIGKINFAASYVSYFSLLATLGISTYAIRVCSVVRHDKEELSKTASQLYSLNVITSSIALALLFSSLFLFNRLDSYKTLIIIESSSIICNCIGLDWLNITMEDMRFITIRTIIVKVITLLAIFLFVKEPQDYIKYAIISLISNNGVYVLNIWYRRKYCSIKFTTNFDFLHHIKPIIALFAMRLVQDIFGNADVTMIGLLVDDFEVGIYTTATRIVVLISQVVSSFLWVMLPRLSRLFNNTKYEEINSLLRRTLGIYLILGIPCAVGIIMLSNDIIAVIAGPQYSSASLPMIILSIKFIFDMVGCSFLGNLILLPSGREREYMHVCVAATIVNVILNYFLIPYYGATGAAFTTTISYVLMFIMLLFYLDKNIRFQNIMPLINEPLIAATSIIIVCIVCHDIENLYIRTSLSVAFSMILYCGILVLLKNESVLYILSFAKEYINKH